VYLLASNTATGTRSNVRVAILYLDELCDRKGPQAVFILLVSGKSPLTDVDNYPYETSFEGQQAFYLMCAE
jgi:hypothetical protein